MDSFFSHSNKPTTNNNNTTHEHKTSASELFASAKVVAGAAQASFGNSNDKLDKAKVADAAGDLLCGASQYGKLDENSGMGKYVHKAEEYLHNYNNSSSSSPSSHSSTTTTDTNTSQSTPNTNTSHSNSGSEGGGHAESGYGDYMKMAEGLFKKN